MLAGTALRAVATYISPSFAVSRCETFSPTTFGALAWDRKDHSEAHRRKMPRDGSLTRRSRNVR